MIVVVPSKVTVPVLAVNAPELDQSPLSLIKEAPEAVTLPPVPMVRPAVVQPLLEDAPMVTSAGFEAASVTVEAPVTARSYVPMARVPDDTVNAAPTPALSCRAHVPAPLDEFTAKL